MPETTDADRKPDRDVDEYSEYDDTWFIDYDFYPEPADPFRWRRRLEVDRRKVGDGYGDA